MALKAPAYKAAPVVAALQLDRLLPGGNAGWASRRGQAGSVTIWHSSHPSAAGARDVSHSYSTHGSGFEGGVQILQQALEQSVIGVETDWQWSGLNETVDASYPFIPSNRIIPDVNAHTEHRYERIEVVFPFRARAGYAIERLRSTPPAALPSPRSRRAPDPQFGFVGGFFGPNFPNHPLCGQ